MRPIALYLIAFFLFFSACRHPHEPFEKRRSLNTASDLEWLYFHGDLPPDPLSLTDIVCIASERNLDAYVRELEWEIQKEVMTSEMLKMLPSLAFNIEHSHRNKNAGASSRNVETGVVGPAITSTSKTVDRWDVTLTWNLLNMGLAYFRSRQATYRSFVTFFQYARVRQNVVLEVYRSYWKAVIAKQAIEKGNRIIELAKKLQASFQTQIEQRTISQINGLKVVAQLLSLQASLQAYYNQYEAAKAELSALMGLPAAIPFEIEIPDIVAVPELEDLCQLDSNALHYRPELYGIDSESEISCDDVYIALLQMLPGVELFVGYNEDNNKFLVHNNWIIAGVRAAWNLLSVPVRAYEAKAAQKKGEMNVFQRMALSVGVISQVHIAYWRFQETLSRFKPQYQAYFVRQQLLWAATQQYRVGEISLADLISYETDAFQAQLDAWISYGDLQIAMEQLNNAMGIPLYYNTLTVEDNDFEEGCDTFVEEDDEACDEE